MNLKLLQLVSPALPVGAYSYSQGLEAAIESGEIRDAASARRWIGDVMELSLSGMEAPVFLRLAGAWRAGDAESVARWNEEFVASREGAELRAETLQMGYSLRRLAHELAIPGADALDAIEELAYPTAFAFAVAAWQIDDREALAAYLFAWAENQVLAALKSVPLGQTEGQRMLLAIAERIPAAVERAASLGDGELFNFAPGFALASSRHETQYSRIFRS
ncbi:MAG TPA: urease accessory protein UreF [Usitatibacter sp.]|nr:urease accessory protein UreF [Usitatibacter sp.]